MTQIAQLNIARLVADKDDPKVAPFMDNLERINGLGKRSDGFVWMMEGDDPAAGNTETHLGDDPRAIVNLTVWRDVASLEHFVFNTVHHQFFKRSGEWFEPADTPRFVMWHVEDGHRPSLDEAMERLEVLRRDGEGAAAFGWAYARKLARADMAEAVQ